MISMRLIFILIFLFLYSCKSMNDNREYSYDTSEGYTNLQDLNMYYFSSATYYYGTDTAPYAQEKSLVNVPEEFHVGPNHSPTSFKERDRNWVQEQNPQSYTVEIADHTEAAQVAKILHQAPKKARMAEIPYYQSGGRHYKGLYGSYPSKEEAEKALEDLPPSLKQKAAIKNWGDIQRVMEN